MTESSFKAIAIYSCVVGNYDLVLPPARQSRPVTFTLYNDSSPASRGWTAAPFDWNVHCSITTNRYHKFFAHRLFPDVDYSIYLDGNIGVVGDLAPLVDEFVDSGCAIGLFRHRDRDTVGRELDACLSMAKFDEADLARYERQLDYYRAQGMPADLRLTDNAVIFRRHDHPALDAAMCSWWEQFQTFTKRDQLSLPYVLWQSSLPTKIWDWSFRTPNDFLEKYPHRSHLLRDIRLRSINVLSKQRSRRRARTCALEQRIGS